MPGPAPKDASLRQRRNKKSTMAGLTVISGEIEDWSLPDRADGEEWHVMAVKVFDDMLADVGSELIQSDFHQLVMLIDLIHRYWSSGDVKLATEIRLQRRDFGVTPLDRARLHWETNRGEQAEGEKERRHRERVPKGVSLVADPRELLSQ